MIAGFGVLLIVGGAIAKWAISSDVDGANLETLGVILMAGGALCLLIAAIQGMGWMSASRRHIQTERTVSADGTHVVEESRER